MTLCSLLLQGAATVRQLLPNIVSIFITAASEAELVARLVARKTEPLEKLTTRVQIARQEIFRIWEYDYVVVNKDGQLDDAAKQISGILQAEKCKVQARSSSNKQPSAAVTSH